jgi:hypothetical protein
MCDTSIPFWLTDKTILLNKKYITNVWPQKQMDNNEKLNSITRLVIYMTILGYLFTNNKKIVISGILTIICIIILYKVQENKLKQEQLDENKPNENKKEIIEEGFYSGNLDANSVYNNQDNMNNMNYQDNMNNQNNMNNQDNTNKSYTQPSVHNPLMNILLPEIGDNPNRKPAGQSYDKSVEQNINNKCKKNNLNNRNTVISCNEMDGANEVLNDNNNEINANDEINNDDTIKNKCYKDLGEAINFDNSMRQFHTTANTTIPNDQEAFAKSLYPNISCKGGDITACRMLDKKTRGGPGSS